MAITAPTGEQLRFVSAKTGEHVLDTYLEAAEIGNRQLFDLLDDIFDTNGIFKAALFQFRYNSDKLQVRVGEFADANAGWTDITTFFKITGTFSSSTTYNNFDFITVANKDVYVVQGLSSAQTFADEATMIASASTFKIVDVSEAQDWAAKVNGLVASTDYSSKAWAIGGTGVTDTASKGAAKEWATKTSGTVDGTNFSAKYWATTGNVATVVGAISNINTVAGISSDVTSVAAKASLITSDFVSDLNTLAVTDVINDINLLATSDIVSDLNTLATSDIVSDLNTLAAADIISDINTLATSDIVADLNTLATTDFVSDLNTMATSANISNLNTVTGSIANVNTVAGANANISVVSTNLSGTNTIGVVSGAIANVNAVGGAIANVNTVSSNLASVNNFGATYKISANAPSSPTEGMMWFDTTNDILKIYDGGNFVNAGTSINGTSERKDYVVGTGSGTYSGSTTSFPATYDIGFADVYLNGVKLAPSDFTANNGTTVVLGSAASTGDTLSIVTYGTFQLADHYTKTQADTLLSDVEALALAGM
jgi:hypothetical protein